MASETHHPWLKLVAFDLDGTLARPGRRIPKRVASDLTFLERHGVCVCIASGKNLEHLEDRARVAGLRRAVLIAENGCVLAFPDPNKVPAVRLQRLRGGGRSVYQLCRRPRELQLFEQNVSRLLGNDVRFQRNRVNVTAFPKHELSLSRLARVATALAGPSLTVTAHDDSVDVMPAAVDKGRALEVVQRATELGPQGTIAVGNGTNDLPMFRKSRLNFIVGHGISFPGAQSYPRIGDVLKVIKARIRA